MQVGDIHLTGALTQSEVKFSCGMQLGWHKSHFFGEAIVREDGDLLQGKYCWVTWNVCRFDISLLISMSTH